MGNARHTSTSWLASSRPGHGDEVLWVLALVVALVASLILTPIVRDRALTLGLVDEPGGRKTHPEPVPRLGGLAIAVAIGLGLAAALAAGETIETLPGAALGIAVLLAVGIVDDVKGVAPTVKLAAHAVAAMAFVIPIIGGPTVSTAEMWVTAIISVAWIVGVINAINLIDGLDGLASGVTLAALVAFGAMAALVGADPVLTLAAATAGAVIGFARYNLPPATIMMGDTGSMILGYLLAIMGVLLVQAGEPVAPWLPVLVLAVPLTDTALAVIRRAIRRQSLFSPDSGHVHHRLLRMGASPTAVTLLMTGAGVAAGAVAVAVVALNAGA
jgi:UDP-GlcNAc:undecaprenyl-phosphate GlcNAc-1-phosphate transferase